MNQALKSLAKQFFSNKKEAIRKKFTTALCTIDHNGQPPQMRIKLSGMATRFNELVAFVRETFANAPVQIEEEKDSIDVKFVVDEDKVSSFLYGYPETDKPQERKAAGKRGPKPGSTRAKKSKGDGKTTTKSFLKFLKNIGLKRGKQIKSVIFPEISNSAIIAKVAVFTEEQAETLMTVLTKAGFKPEQKRLTISVTLTVGKEYSGLASSDLAKYFSAEGTPKKRAVKNAKKAAKKKAAPKKALAKRHAPKKATIKKVSGSARISKDLEIVQHLFGNLKPADQKKFLSQFQPKEKAVKELPYNPKELAVQLQEIAKMLKKK